MEKYITFDAALGLIELAFLTLVVLLALFILRPGPRQ